jgi:hypothetical protein
VPSIKPWMSTGLWLTEQPINFYSSHYDIAFATRGSSKEPGRKLGVCQKDDETRPQKPDAPR